MSKATITLYNREYTVNCGPGEEPQLQEVVALVESTMHDVAGGVGNATESRLLMLTCLRLADQLREMKREMVESRTQDEDLFVAAVEHLRQRVNLIAGQVGRA
jgi:cell division protein ZapA